MSTPAAKAAAAIRRELRRMGHDTRGMVRVRSNDYITEIEIDATGVDYLDINEACNAADDYEPGRYFTIEITGTPRATGWGI